MNILILGAGAGTGSDVINCLADRHSLQLADTDPFADGFYLWDAGRHLLKGDAEAIRQQIKRIIREEGITLLFANEDRFLYLLAPLYQDIQQMGCYIPHPSPERMLMTLDRKQLYETMYQAGISVPLASDPILDFPLVVKGRIQKLENDYYLIENSEALSLTIGMIERSKITPWTECYVPGRIDQVYLVSLIYDNENKLIMSFTARKLQEASGRGGLTLAAISERNPELAELAQTAAQAIGAWRGPCSAKFKIRSTDGSTVLLSLKPRFNDCTSLASACGLNLPQVIVDIAAGRTRSVLPEYESDMVMVRYNSDIICRATEIVWKE